MLHVKHYYQLLCHQFSGSHWFLWHLQQPELDRSQPDRSMLEKCCR